jgi:broad specificity phosphatase PhoE
VDYTTKLYLDNQEECKRIQLITSPSRRTHMLATEIGNLLSVEVYSDSRVSEMNFGIFEGLTVEEAKIHYPDAYTNFCNALVQQQFLMENPIAPLQGESKKSLMNSLSEEVY